MVLGCVPFSSSRFVCIILLLLFGFSFLASVCEDNFSDNDNNGVELDCYSCENEEKCKKQSWRITSSCPTGKTQACITVEERVKGKEKKVKSRGCVHESPPVGQRDKDGCVKTGETEWTCYCDKKKCNYSGSGTNKKPSSWIYFLSWIGICVFYLGVGSNSN